MKKIRGTCQKGRREEEVKAEPSRKRGGSTEKKETRTDQEKRESFALFLWSLKGKNPIYWEGRPVSS